MTTDVVVRSLAVLGGAVGGGLGLGLLVQLLMRATMVRKPPRWSVLVVRLLGGVISGWLVALWLFGGGGPGIGGAGGFGFGSGSGQGNREEAKDPGENSKAGTASETKTRATPRESLRIEVLGKDVLPESDIAAERWYRVETEQGERLVTFEQVKEEVAKRQHQQPPLRRVEIVLYKDSPDERVPIVSRLRTWAGDANGGKLKVDISRPDTNASRR